MINAVVEGESDTGIVRAIIRAANGELGRIVPKGGKSKIDPLLPNYNQAARHTPWVVFRDSDTECPKELYQRLTSGIVTPSPSFLLRIAHPMSEAWLLADQSGFSRYFQVRSARIPRDPETLANPKQTVLRLCAESRSRDIRRDMVVQETKTGPLYVHRINEFAMTSWDVEAAASSSDSLRRALHRIRQLPAGNA